jgi:G3E family GTPase
MTLPLTVIGGYLGAGKTTLLNQILTGNHGRRIAVIVNDFGALNVDASLIADHEGDTVALTNGCVCCSAVDGTTEAIARFLRTPEAFDHIVIEASGVAEPGKVARNAAAFRLPLDGVIVLVDAEQFPDQAVNKYVGRSVLAQLLQADLIVLNKTDLASPSRLAETRELIARHRPEIQVLQTEQARLPHDVIFGVRTAAGHTDPPPESSIEHDDHAGLYEAGQVDADPMPRAQFEAWAEVALGPVIRAKGPVALSDAPGVRHLYQKVGRRWTLAADGDWGAAEPRTQLVTIRVRDSVREDHSMNPAVAGSA